MRLRTGQSCFASRPLSGSMVTVTVASAAGAEVMTSVELTSGASVCAFGLTTDLMRESGESDWGADS